MKVGVITPTTRDRVKFNERIQKIFDSQDYPDKQHIMILGEGTIGSKRNKAIECSSADIIIHMDSDDFFAPDYISRCVEQLKTCDSTGLSSAYFTNGMRSWIYEYRGSQPYILGSGMAYHRRVWEKNKFKDTSKGEDTTFCANAGIIKPLNYLEGFIAQIHNSNTESQKAIHLMKPVELPKPLWELMESF